MDLPIDVSLAILDGVYSRWAALWRTLAPGQFRRTYQYPEIGIVTLDTHL
jgi:hypothetical protein